MAVMNEDVFFASVTELSAQLRAKAFTATELARAFATRLEQLSPRYNALALSTGAIARDAAKNVDDDLKRERYRSLLQGIPFGAKDLLSLAGKPTTWGARPYAGQIFDYTATVLQKLAKTGAVLIGKLAMIELAGGGGYRYAAASLTGPCLNPWDRARWAGGSSSGSGAAVAAGLVPYAIGSETWGSILTPAAYCGVTGLRPTYGLVSRYGAMALSWTMDKIGLLGRTAEDCGLVLQVISGGDSKDPGSSGKTFFYAPQYVRPLKDLTVGYAPVDFEEWAQPETRPAFQQALAALRQTGVKVVEAKLPDFPYGAAAGTIISAEGAAVFEPLINSGRVEELADKKQIAGLKAGLEIAAKDYLKAMRIRSLVKQELKKLFLDIDLLVSPSTLDVAPMVSDPLDGRGDRKSPPPRRGLTDLGAAGNLGGLPALSLPCGFAGNLPVAVQLVGPAYTENTLLAVGREFQRLTDWHRKRPPAAA